MKNKIFTYILDNYHHKREKDTTTCNLNITHKQNSTIMWAKPVNLCFGHFFARRGQQKKNQKWFFFIKAQRELIFYFFIFAHKMPQIAPIIMPKSKSYTKPIPKPKLEERTEKMV